MYNVVPLNNGTNQLLCDKLQSEQEGSYSLNPVWNLSLKFSLITFDKKKKKKERKKVRARVHRSISS